MKIDKHCVGDGPVFVIAEIGNNHNGSFDLAIEMIDSANKAGANCVKFQIRNLETLYTKSSLAKEGSDLGTEYTLDLLKRFELSYEQHTKLFRYCHQIGITYMCTPWDHSSVKFLESLKVCAYKIASADLTNLDLIGEIAKTKKPIILSTGMSTEDEIRLTAKFLAKKKAIFALLHCNSTYPAPLHDINLNWISKLKKIHPLIGYSGHERGITVSLASIALGAKILERHFTFDRDMEGPDHAASLEPEDFSLLVKGIREIEVALGDGKTRIVSQGEMINRENLSKSLVAAFDLPIGTVIRDEHIALRSPGQGLSAQYRNRLIGKKLLRDITIEDYFFESDLLERTVEPSEYKFTRPWGIPVRYHDFTSFSQKIRPDIFEFHLSYSDMDLNISSYFSETNEAGFVVHAPELFSEGRLMDLASIDEDYRAFNILETQRVINITRSLKQYFPSCTRPLIVANIGGFTMDKPLEEDELSFRYELFSKSLNSLDLDGVELIPQTMAPFPWHFGGQRYQNLFVKANEIVYWCKRLNLRICFDVSHTKLTCEYLNIDFYEFSEKIAPITAHIHIGDAKGVNGEGLQIGDGEIDFKRLSEILKRCCPKASFIPEIWQGHKNRGEGFWLALERLRGLL